MRVIFSVTDEDCRNVVLEEVNAAEEAGYLKFPNDAARAEFVNDCTDVLISDTEFALERMFSDEFYTRRDVLDMAKDYGYNTVTEA